VDDNPRLKIEDRGKMPTTDGASAEALRGSCGYPPSGS
jgi:hypothetical protein